MGIHNPNHKLLIVHLWSTVNNPYNHELDKVLNWEPGPPNGFDFGVNCVEIRETYCHQSFDFETTLWFSFQCITTCCLSLAMINYGIVTG